MDYNNSFDLYDLVLTDGPHEALFMYRQEARNYALILSVWGGKRHALTALLAAGADPGTEGKWPPAPLGHHSADALPIFFRGWAPLGHAATWGDPFFLRAILPYHPPQWALDQALRVAAEHGRLEGVRALLDAGAKDQNYAAVRAAAYAGRTDILGILLDGRPADSPAVPWRETAVAHYRLVAERIAARQVRAR